MQPISMKICKDFAEVVHMNIRVTHRDEGFGAKRKIILGTKVLGEHEWISGDE